jgi:hypothetical protein
VSRLRRMPDAGLSAAHTQNDPRPTSSLSTTQSTYREGHS